MVDEPYAAARREGGSGLAVAARARTLACRAGGPILVVEALVPPVCVALLPVGNQILSLYDAHVGSGSAYIHTRHEAGPPCTFRSGAG